MLRTHCYWQPIYERNIMQLHELGRKNQKIWICDDVKPYFQRNWFDIRGEGGSRTWSKTHGGRQAVHRFTVNNSQFVLRHYFRGGMPAHLTKDRFLFRGWHVTRPYKELKLLLEMSQLGLPVPFPAAARCVVDKFSYSADIIMVEIPDTEALATILGKRELAPEEWRAIGKTILRFHRLGFQHVDLNANNILLDRDGNVHLIDFDRCMRRQYAKSWALAGLARLQRSLNKLQRANHDLFFQQSDFQNLSDAYHE